MLSIVATAGPSSAHPHIFIDAGLTIIRDAERRPVAVEVRWRYDEFNSLLYLEDYGLDPDFDLVLTDAEVAGVLGFDLNWNSGFEGGLVLRQDGVELDIGPPEPVSLSLLPSGQIETVHRRPVTGGAPFGTLEAQVFDQAFYIAFEMILEVGVAATPDCTSELIRADLDAAYAILAAAIDDIGGSISAEDNFPPVGDVFADRVVMRCPE